MTIVTAATVAAGMVLVVILMMREVGIAHFFRRRGRRPAAELYVAPPANSNLHKRTTSVAGDPDANRGQGKMAPIDVDESASQSSRATGEISAPARQRAARGALEGRLDPSLAPERSKTVEATPENGRIKPPPRMGTPADDELEVLKAKLGKPVAPVDDRRQVEVETLRTKLGGERGRKSKTTAGNLSKAKLAARGSLQGLGRDRRPATPASKGPAAPSGPAAAGATDQLLSVQQHPASKCHIVWSRGYLKSVFRAVAKTATGDVSVIAESPRFRWYKADPPPQTTQAVHAHRALVEVLERAGWSVALSGEHWYALELECPQKRRRRRASGDEAA